MLFTKLQKKAVVSDFKRCFILMAISEIVPGSKGAKWKVGREVLLLVVVTIVILVILALVLIAISVLRLVPVAVIVLLS